MTLQSSLDDIASRLSAGKYASRAAIAEGVVRRILDELDWPRYDTELAAPEFRIGSVVVDYAIFSKPGCPVAVLQAVAPESDLRAEQRTLREVGQAGIRLALVTNGDEYQVFYLDQEDLTLSMPIADLSLRKDDKDILVEALESYFARREHLSGDALRSANEKFVALRLNESARRSLPSVWRELIQDEDEMLIELIRDKAKRLGFADPSPWLVMDFLTEELTVRDASSPQASGSFLVNQSGAKSNGTSRMAGFKLQGAFYPADSGRDALFKFLRELARRDDSFLDRFAATPKGGRTRRYIARSRSDLFTVPQEAAFLEANTREILPGSGWWMDLNLPHVTIDKLGRIAAGVAGLGYGTDTRLYLDSRH